MNNNRYITIAPDPWFRSNHGIIAGVCTGLAKKLGTDPWVVRLIWLATIFLFGTGLLAYLILAISLPREDRLMSAYYRRVLGVGARLALYFGIDVGLVRAGLLSFFILSAGTAIVVYLLLHLVLNWQNEPRYLPDARYQTSNMP